MVPEAVIVGLRIVVLVLLWGFVLAAVVAVRHDVFGGRRMTPAPPRSAAPTQPVPSAKSKSDAKRKSAPPRQIVVTDGPLAGTTLPLAGGPITIGRAPESTLVLSDDFASNHHARLSPRDGQWIVEDLGSTNGTYVGRTRVREPIAVAAETPIRVGRTVLELRS